MGQSALEGENLGFKEFSMFRKKISGIMILIVGIMFVGAIAIGFTACGDFSGDDANAEYGWYGKGSASTFTISNATQLAELAKIVWGSRWDDDVPAQSDFKGKTVTLAADIDMSGKSWRGLGYSYIPLYPFNGTFDGNNKTISGLRADNQGFFGLIGEDGIVKNIVFVDLNFSGSDGGGGVARTNEGKVQNISIINGSGGSGGGGVVYSNAGIVENCNFSGIITSGLGGSGGIATSNTTSGVIRSCYVTGSVTNNSASGSGGIVGSNRGTVQNCYTICSATNGGIAAYNGGTIKNCYAAGDVTGGNWHGVGGIAGSNDGTIQNCAALNPSITSVYSYIGRVADGNSGFLNNYGSSGMTLPSAVTVTSDPNGIHGADVEASDYNSQTWWTTSSNWNSVSLWDFTTVWEWDSTRNLPKLR